MAQMDATVVNVALPALVMSLRSSLATIQWVISGYLLALALMLPLNAWLVERMGARALYLWCFAAFTLFSGLCGLAWSTPSLIAFRVVQGASGGLMAPLAQMMMARVAGRNMARVFGYVSMPILLGPVVGPVLAGAILMHGSWRWLFFFNLPLGVLGLALAFVFLPREREAAQRRPFDFAGFLLLSPGLVVFLYGAEYFRERMGQAALALAVLLLAGFFRVAVHKQERAIVDLQLFRSRVFSAAAVAQFIGNGLMFAGQMLVPVYLIRLCGRTEAATGWMMASLGLGMMCTFPLMGAFTERFGIRRLAAGGAVLALAGTLPLVYLAGHMLSIAVLVAALFLRGAGLSAVGLPSVTGAYSSVRKEELPMATTSMNIVQRLGGPTLTTVCATVLAWRMTAGLPAQAFVASFALLSILHAVLALATLRLPLRVEPQQQS
ncbi:DHA2 family efflux MFS transporter permease subunit [Silvibacterium dinghuense]|uniref:DHA2 family efflux MFS transporter permease subunit n=2 Tax=Silvibacterium dinghuense TaxID=1560006 RepID=A0A4Q1SAI2_9BACT|nr:DHA2 family efflux MFS transporter permease subunit [Silvibacterium dinghuense]